MENGSFLKMYFLISHWKYWFYEVYTKKKKFKTTGMSFGYLVIGLFHPEVGCESCK